MAKLCASLFYHSTRFIIAVRAMQKGIFRFLWMATWEDPEKQQILESIPLLTVINHRLCQGLLLGMIKDQDPTTQLCSTAVTAGGFHMWAAPRSFYTRAPPFSRCSYTRRVDIASCLLLLKHNNNKADLKNINPWPHTDTYKLAHK